MTLNTCTIEAFGPAQGQGLVTGCASHMFILPLSLLSVSHPDSFSFSQSRSLLPFPSPSPALCLTLSPPPFVSPSLPLTHPLLPSLPLALSSSLIPLLHLLYINILVPPLSLSLNLSLHSFLVFPPPRAIPAMCQPLVPPPPPRPPPPKKQNHKFLAPKGMFEKLLNKCLARFRGIL